VLFRATRVSVLPPKRFLFVHFREGAETFEVGTTSGTLRASGASMFFAPFPLLFTLLVGLLSTAVLGGGLYLLWAWYVGIVVGTGYLLVCLAMTLWTFLGRWIVLRCHPRGHDEPHTRQPRSEVRLLRPDGTSLTFCRLFPELLGPILKGLALVDTSHTNPARTTTASGFVRAIQKPILEPLLHLMACAAPAVWVMSWLGYFNGSSHLIGIVFGFAGNQTRGQLDLATRYNPLAWPGVQAHETLAMFRYDATSVLSMIPIPTRVFTGHLDRLIVPETARFMSEWVPHAQLKRLAPAGHMAVFERRDGLVSELAVLAEEVLPRDDQQAVAGRVGRGAGEQGVDNDFASEH